jgi:hypothetical protein
MRYLSKYCRIDFDTLHSRLRDIRGWGAACLSFLWAFVISMNSRVAAVILTIEDNHDHEQGQKPWRALQGAVVLRQF